MIRLQGKPILAATSGIFFGLFLAIALQQWSIYPLTPLSVIGLPVLGFILGLILAAWAPFGRPKVDETDTELHDSGDVGQPG